MSGNTMTASSRGRGSFSAQQTKASQNQRRSSSQGSTSSLYNYILRPRDYATNHSDSGKASNPLSPATPPHSLMLSRPASNLRRVSFSDEIIDESGRPVTLNIPEHLIPTQAGASAAAPSNVPPLGANARMWQSTAEPRGEKRTRHTAAETSLPKRISAGLTRLPGVPITPNPVPTDSPPLSPTHSRPKLEDVEEKPSQSENGDDAEPTVTGLKAGDGKPILAEQEVTQNPGNFEDNKITETKEEVAHGNFTKGNAPASVAKSSRHINGLSGHRTPNGARSNGKEEEEPESRRSWKRLLCCR